MTGFLDAAILDQESQRMGNVLGLLNTFVRRGRLTKSGLLRARHPELAEAELDKVSVAEFRRRCTWE